MGSYRSERKNEGIRLTSVKNPNYIQDHFETN